MTVVWARACPVSVQNTSHLLPIPAPYLSFIHPSSFHHPWSSPTLLTTSATTTRVVVPISTTFFCFFCDRTQLRLSRVHYSLDILSACHNPFAIQSHKHNHNLIHSHPTASCHSPALPSATKPSIQKQLSANHQPPIINMSGKLDQGLDEIISTQRRAVGGRRQNQRRSTGGRPATTAPIGGVKKTTKQPKGPATKQGAAKATGANGDSKVVVSNLVRSR